MSDRDDSEQEEEPEQRASEQVGGHCFVKVDPAPSSFLSYCNAIYDITCDCYYSYQLRSLFAFVFCFVFLSFHFWYGRLLSPSPLVCYDAFICVAACVLCVCMSMSTSWVQLFRSFFPFFVVSYFDVLSCSFSLSCCLMYAKEE